ncbi:GATA zinc finger domain-containing protein 8 [Condylostylus longicornis]|uniref:GATA zinc finger domain-containing protein 8 n=1 Tax=Condylostylus longicornis TaxID=2530218 RepID=UPI00244DDA2C|nr:GATA zinc finger domain-containing protein 8 [Condylostylus longicornis]
MMDDVPVKISEKYKPPPKVNIPQTIINRLNSEGYPPGIFDYDFALENSVIKNVENWKRVREIEKVNRQSRLQKLELEQAREIEEKQKQLLTTVSYPNADEISSGDEAESDSSPEATNSTAPSVTPVNVLTCNPETLNQVYNQQNYNTILKPTVLPDRNMPNLVNSQTPVTWKGNLGSNLKPNMGGKINYSDFENDTSSPFDNVELKTINDLDILAQVYNISHSNNSENLKKENAINDLNSVNEISQKVLNSDIRNEEQIENTSVATNNGISVSQSGVTSPIYWKNNNSSSNVTQIQSGNFEVPNTSINHYYQLQQNYTNMNGSLSNPQHFLTNQDNYYFTGYGNVPANQNYQFSNYMSNNDKDKTSNSPCYTNYLNFNNQHNFNTYRTNFQPTTITCNSPTITYGNLNQYRSPNLNQRIVSNIPVNINQTESNNLTLKQLTLEESAIQSIRSKSKSVPDILKELDDEVRDSESRRIRNHSQTLEDYAAKCKQQIENQNKKLPESFLKLSPSSQNLIQNISSMGFPIERVAKIADKLGTDDKKIVEHLIPLSELLDLGFEEEKISEALLKYDNNKDKALDYLIS